MKLTQYRPRVISIDHAAVNTRNISLTLLDIANLHPLASGNKLFKLAPNIDYAIEQGFKQVLSFGGAYSNHIHALAAYGQDKGLQTIGIIRGEPEYSSNPTLQAAQNCGMQLEFVDRQTYQQRNNSDYLDILAKKYPSALILPEGGSNVLAVEGCKQLAKLINSHVSKVDIVAVACGTGGTLAGLVSGLKTNYPQEVWGFSVVRDASLPERIDDVLAESDSDSHINFQLIPADYGGYAKFDKTLLSFIMDWLDKTGILLDPIYTSKMCRKLVELIEGDNIPDNSHLCLLHTGGLQAWYGMKNKVVNLGRQATWDEIDQRLRVT